MSARILSSIDGPIGTLVFNNPERHNAMSLEMWRDAATGFDTLASNHAVRVMILTGAGSKAFISGADISKFESERASAEEVENYNFAVEQFSRALLASDKPVIAMMRGYCIGGGVGVAASCDLRICNESSQFGIPAAKLGLAYDTESIRRLIDLIGPQFVTEMLFTARHFNAAEALRIGFVNSVVPDARIEEYVRDLAAGIAENAPLSIRATKSTIRELLRGGDTQQCESLIRQCFESDDYREGRRAFLEKRKPLFRGR